MATLHRIEIINPSHLSIKSGHYESTENEGIHEVKRSTLPAERETRCRLLNMSGSVALTKVIGASTSKYSKGQYQLSDSRPALPPYFNNHPNFWCASFRISGEGWFTFGYWSFQ